MGARWHDSETKCQTCYENELPKRIEVGDAGKCNGSYLKQRAGKVPKFLQKSSRRWQKDVTDYHVWFVSHQTHLFRGQDRRRYIRFDKDSGRWLLNSPTDAGWDTLYSVESSEEVPPTEGW